MKKSAIFSEDKKYRYQLSRIFDEQKPLVAFVGLNPSIAGIEETDKTIDKCIRLCTMWGYGGFYMINLFAYISTDPEQLKVAKNIIGDDNDKHIEEVISKVDKVICCWGDNAKRTDKYKDRYKEVLKLIPKPYCLKINATGHPAHPLYLKEEGLMPIEYKKE